MNKRIRPVDAGVAVLDTIVKQHLLTDIEQEARLTALLLARGNIWADILHIGMQRMRDKGDTILAYYIGKVIEEKIRRAIRAMLSEDESAHRNAKRIFYYLVAYRRFIYSVVAESSYYEVDTSWDAVIAYLQKGKFAKHFPEIPEDVVRSIRWLSNVSKKTYQNNRKRALECMYRAINPVRAKQPQIDVSRYMEQSVRL